MNAPSHKSETTSNAALDRIQNNVRDLVAYVRSLRWLERRAYAALSTNATSTTSYVTLLEATISSDLVRSSLEVTFSACGGKITNAGTVSFQVLVDGTVVKGCRTSVPLNFSFTASLLARVAVSRGMHTVKVQWKADTASATLSASSTVENHAALTVHEVPS